MTVGENTLYFSYDADGTPMSVNFNGTEYYYTSNLQGDVIGIVNSQGETVVTYTYDAWGNILSTTDTTTNTLGTINPLRYRGYVYDQETNLYYLQSRYYNPEIGRFINADGMTETGQGLLGNNMFAYCLNNPENGMDPCGTCFHRWDFWNDCEKCGGRTFGEKCNDAIEFLENNIGFALLQGNKYDVISWDTFFFGSESGFSTAGIITGDVSKPISFYVECPSIWWNFANYKVGVQINSNYGSFRYSSSRVETSIAYANDGNACEIMVGLNKLGYTVSSDVNADNYSAGIYTHEYIRPVPTACAVAGAIYFWEFVGAAAALFLI